MKSLPAIRSPTLLDIIRCSTYTCLSRARHKHPSRTYPVMDALAHVGVRHIDTPLTPEKIWQALHGKEV
jgi:hypothetical protein